MSTVSRHLTQIGKVKKLDKWVPHELTKNQNNHHSEVLSPLTLHNNNEPFLHRILWYAMKTGFYMTTSNDQISGWTEKKLQSTSQIQTCTKKKGSWLLVVCCPSDPLQLSESWLNHYIWEVCSGSRWNIPITTTPEAGIDQQKGPNSSPWNTQPHITQPTLQKLNELGYKVLPHPPYSPDLSPTDYLFVKHLDNLLQGKHFHNQQEAENVFQESVESRSRDFYAIGINKLISHWQKCVDCNGSYFD